jgi:hydrogenase maturation protease
MLLVIGYGNELRRDDGVGPRVARSIAAEGWPGVEAVAVHQLTPELAEDVGKAEAVVFVDAAADGPAGVAWHRLRPQADVTLGHVSSPQGLLALVAALAGHCPEAWLLTIRGSDFGFGAGQTAQAEQGFRAALSGLREWLTSCAAAAPAPARARRESPGP